jgi:hypothetical protein
MNLEKLFNAAIIRNTVNAAAAIKAVGFFLTFFIVGGGLLAYIVKEQAKNDAALVAVAAAYLGLVVVLSITIWYYVKHICDPEPYEIAKLEGVLSIEASGDHHRYSNKRIQTVKALRNNVRLIEVRSHWTGSHSRQNYSVQSVSRGHELFDGLIREEDARVHRWIYLRRPLGKRDDPVTVGVSQEWQDDLEAMWPYYREGGARYKTRDLKITVRFRAQDAPDQSDVEGFIWNTAKTGIIGHVEVQRHYDRQASCVEYVVVVPKPKRFHSYGVRWAWPDHPQQSKQVT